jgi:hypothetical protein
MTVAHAPYRSPSRGTVSALTAVVLVLLTCGAAWASRKCSKPGEELHRLSRASTVDDDVLERARRIVKNMPPKCFKGQVTIEVDREEIAVGSVTYLFGRICQRNASLKAVKYFLGYRLDKWDSPDEELSLSLERVFVSNPGPILGFISKQPDSVRARLMNDIAWGFLSNRVYGPENPYEDRERRTFLGPEDLPKQILNLRNYKRIFFRLHDDMPRLAKQYPDEVEFILEQVRLFLEQWGKEY